MKKLYLFAALAAMLAACSENDKLSKEQTALQNAEPGAVTFEAYTQRGVTRAGQTDVMTNEKLKAAVNLTDQNGGGFGVFGYYTDNNDYEQSRTPDFMYNQLVEWDQTGSYWKYSPIKYWPNEYGSNAISDDADKVTFFAYAPYVATNGSGKIERTTGDDLSSYGITGLSRNSNQGDPIVKYIASFERDKSVDLLWGVVGTAEATGWNLTNGGSQSLDAGKPWLNVMRPSEAATQEAARQRIKFTFDHALTQLTMKIDAIVDEINKGSNTLADGTKIYVRQLSMTGVALKGALNLNNSEAGENKALWLDYNGLADIESGVPVVLYDGRKDGKEGVSGATASNEKTVGFNADIISNDGNTSKGVTASAKNVFADDPVMLIPTGENMELEIIYDVETEDDMLPTLLSDGTTPGSSIENKVRKTINFPQNGIANGLENGKHYTINLHLGMNSVKFDVADIEPWKDDVNQPNVDLPSNGSTSVHGKASAASTAITEFPAFTGFAWDVEPIVFTVTGLTPNEEVASAVVSTSLIDALYNGSDQAQVEVNSTSDFSGTPDNKANGDGTVYVQVTLKNNKFVHKLAPTNNYILIEGKTSLTGWKARFEQDAHPFGLQVKSLANGSGTTDVITLQSTYTAPTEISANALDLDDDIAYGAPAVNVADFVKVSVNGDPLTYKANPAAAEYEYDGSSKTITIGNNLKIGDKVTITVAALDESGNEDGSKETVEFTVGGISYALSTPQELTASTTQEYDVLVPTIVGDNAGAVSYAAYADITDELTVNGTKITASKAMDAANGVTASITPTSNPGDAYFYTAKTKTASYKVQIVKQATTLNWTIGTPVVTGIAVSSGTTINFGGSLTLNGDLDGVISTSPTVTYTVTEVKYGSTTKTTDATDLFDFDSSTLKSKTNLTEATSYEVKIKATYAATDMYDGSTVEKSITVQTVGY